LSRSNFCWATRPCRRPSATSGPSRIWSMHRTMRSGSRSRYRGFVVGNCEVPSPIFRAGRALGQEQKWPVQYKRAKP
jgi:hypothetical protein